MYKNIIFTLALLSTTVSVQAMNFEYDEKSDKIVLKATHRDLTGEDGSPLKTLAEQKEKMSKFTTRIFSSLSHPSVKDCEGILEAYETYEKAKAQVGVGLEFTPKYQWQLHRYLALAKFFLATDDSHEKKRTLFERIPLFVDCLGHCRSYLSLLDGQEDGEAVRPVITYILAFCLMETSPLSTKLHEEKYSDAMEAAQLFENASIYQEAYYSYLNAYEFLIASPQNSDQKRMVIKSKLKSLFPYLDKEETAKAKIAKRIQGSDNGPRKSDVRELRKGVKNWRVLLEDRAENYIEMAETFLRQKNVENATSFLLAGAKDYIGASLYAAAPKKSEELLQKAVGTIRAFEKTVHQLLSSSKGETPLEFAEVFRVYKEYYTGELNRITNPTLLRDLKEFIYAFIWVEEYAEAKKRCDVLCQFEEEEGELTEETRFIRMKVNALNGDLDELIAHLDQKKVEAEKRKAKNKVKKEKQKAKRLAKLQEEKAKAEQKVVSQDKNESDFSAVQPKSKEVRDEHSEPDGMSFEIEKTENLAGEYRNQEIREKVKTKGTPSPAAVPIAPDEIEESPRLVKKVLPPKLFEMCSHLLKGGRSLSRDEVLKLFADLNCEINETRGKGSHAIIRYVKDKRDGSVIGCWPEFEQKRIEEEEEDDVETQEGSNITMTLPKDWGKQMHSYIAKALRGMLERMGYTLATIEKKNTLDQHQKTNAKKKKRTTRKKKKK